MADPTPVNGQITDAVTQSNITVLAQSPAMALGSLYEAHAQALALAMQNAVAHQQAGNEIALATVTRSVQALVPSAS